VIRDRYELIEPIGSGGMATVWRATDHVLDRMVAIKRLSPHLATDPTSAARFKREAQAAARLNHPGIVTVYDTGEDEDGPYIVLELVEGQTLADRLRDGGPLVGPEVALIVQQAAAALDHAHANGVVHRDIKPSNLIIESNGSVRLTDFGIALVIDDVTTLTSQDDVIGTVAYMAPEVLAGEPASPASDIYSLGAITYEMLSGSAPYQADSLGALLTTIQAGVVAPLRGVGEAMAEAVSRALSTNPAERPPSGGAFAMALVAGTTIPLKKDLIAPVTGGSVQERLADDPTLVLTGPTDPPSNRERRCWGWIVAPVPVVVAVLAIAAMIDRRTHQLRTPPSLDGRRHQHDHDEHDRQHNDHDHHDDDNDDRQTRRMPWPVDSAAWRPPTTEYKPKDVRDVEEAFATLMQEWAQGDVAEVVDEFAKVFEAVGKLSESPEREEIVAMVVRLGEAMGFAFESDNDD
jgi:serine/threonine protein kinase